MFFPSPEVWQTIEATELAAFVRESMWAYPVLETLHIIGLGLLFGSIVAFDLRVLGLNDTISLTSLGEHLLPWVWTGFVLNATSGLLLFASDAVEFSTNPALWWKLALIFVAGLNAAVFQTRLKPAAAAPYGVDPAPTAARISAGLSILLWTAILVAGRMIAYVK